MGKLKLYYFNGRGLAETIRLILAVVGEDYIDFRYPLKILDYKTFDSIREEFNTDKADGKLLKSLNKLPYLEVDNKIICQSKAIERYLGKRFYLMGSTDIESAQIDAICECVLDIKTEYRQRLVLTRNNKESWMSKWFDETLPEKLQLLDNIVGYNHSVGSKLSLSDIVLYSFITQFFDNTEGTTNAVNTTRNIKSVVNNVSNISGIQDWLKNRPVTEF